MIQRHKMVTFIIIFCMMIFIPAVNAHAQECFVFETRGDVNGDRSIDLTDGIRILRRLFTGGPSLECPRNANTNGDDVAAPPGFPELVGVNMSDSVYLFLHLFAGGPVPVLRPDLCLGEQPASPYSQWCPGTDTGLTLDNPNSTYVNASSCPVVGECVIECLSPFVVQATGGCGCPAGTTENVHGNGAITCDSPAPVFRYQVFELEVLDPLQSISRSEAFDVNDNGQVVGSSSTRVCNGNSPCGTHAVVWTSPEPTDLHDSILFRHSVAEKINNNGLVYGYGLGLVELPGNCNQLWEHGFKITNLAPESPEVREMELLRTPDDRTAMRSGVLNNNNILAANSLERSGNCWDFGRSAVRHNSTAGQYVFLPRVNDDSYDFYFPMAINDGDFIAGRRLYYAGVDGDGNVIYEDSVVLWYDEDRDGIFDPDTEHARQMQIPDGCVLSDVFSMAMNQNMIIGSVRCDPERSGSEYLEYPLRWNFSGSMNIMIEIFPADRRWPQYPGVYPLDINASNKIVGWYRNPTEDDRRAAFYADFSPAGERRLINLNDEIDPESGWHLESANGINVRGEIVGYGTKNGQRRGFILAPTAP